MTKPDDKTPCASSIIIPFEILIELLVRYLKQPRDGKTQERDIWWAQKLQNHGLDNQKEPRQ